MGKNTVTIRFRQQLQNMGGMRMAELCASFNGPLPVREQDCEMGASQALGASWASFSGNDTLTPSPRSLGRVSSAPVLAPSPTSSRVASSPRPSLGGSSALASPTNLNNLNVVDLPSIMPHQRWGTESADRFRLFSAVTGSFGGQR